MQSDSTAQSNAQSNTQKQLKTQTDAASNRVEPSTVTGSKFALHLPKTLSKPLMLGAAILLAGGAIASFNFAQRAPRSLSPAGTQLVPKSALATMTVTTDELTWTKLRQFGTPETQDQFDSLLRMWKTRLFTDNGYSFKRDIKPWIGDRVTLALLSAAKQPADQPAIQGLAAATQNLVLVVPIADPMKAKALLKDGRNALTSGNEGENEETRAYKGVDIKTIETEDATIQAAVIGRDWLLLSNGAAGIEQAIDTYKGGRSLLTVTGYRKAAQRIESPQPPGKNFAQIYFNIPNITQALQPPAGPADRRISRASIVPLQGSQGIVATALIESEGIRLAGTSWLLPQNDLAYSEFSNEASEMPRRLPDNTLIMMSGSNLQTFWRGFRESNTAPPFFPNPQNLEAGLLTQTGLNLNEDILPWAAGEFAFGVLPPVAEATPSTEGSASDDLESASDDLANDPVVSGEGLAEGNEPNVVEPAIQNAPLVMMVQTNDRQLAESAWSQLDDVMASRYRYDVTTESFDGGSITQWVSPFEGVQFSHGWLPGNVAFFTVGAGAATALAPKPQRTLAEVGQFQTLTAKAPRPNNGHFYLDLEQINALDGNVFPLPDLPEDGTQAAINAIGLTATVGDRTGNRTMDYDLYIKLDKGPKPDPL
ncbi:MAG: DUF3352 domain-containing protein [Cyanobacteria bacterium P01_D01_bin.105]